MIIVVETVIALEMVVRAAPHSYWTSNLASEHIAFVEDGRLGLRGGSLHEVIGGISLALRDGGQSGITFLLND